MRKFKCAICGYIYDETEGIASRGIEPKTKWEDISDDFVCPICMAPKSVFKLIEEAEPVPLPTINANVPTPLNLNGLSAGEISAICSNLAKGCEKQRLMAEMEAFNKIADYFKSKTVAENNKTLDDVIEMLDNDMSEGFALANAAAKASTDRGALRSLVWSEKVSTMMKMLLNRFANEGEAMLENTNIYVCDICGFIHIGQEPPEICPVCKVPNYKIIQVERR